MSSKQWSNKLFKSKGASSLIMIKGTSRLNLIMWQLGNGYNEVIARH